MSSTIIYPPFPSPPTLPNPFIYPMALKLFPPQLAFFPDQNYSIYPQLLQPPHAINVFTMVITGRTAQNTSVPIAMSLPQLTQLTTVCSSSVTSIGIGVREPTSAPITTVQFVLNQGISWVIVCLNAYPLHSHLLPMEALLPPPSSHSSVESLVIEPGARLYGRDNIMIFLLFCHILLISFNTSHHYWRGLCPSNNSYLVITGPTSFFLFCL